MAADPAILKSLVETITHTAGVMKSFLASQLGRDVESTHGKEKFSEMYGVTLEVIIAVNNQYRTTKEMSPLIQGPLAEVFSGDYYGDLQGDAALKALEEEIKALEERVQTRDVANFYL